MIRAGILPTNQVFVQLTKTTALYLPNPTPEGRTYDPNKILPAIIKAVRINPTHWRSIEVSQLP